MTIVDIIVVTVILLSAGLAFLHGFVREALSIGSWVGAAFVALWAFPFAAPLARTHIHHPIAADAAAGAVVFLIALIIFSLISQHISRFAHDSGLGAIDRSLGFVFGAIRGAVLICLSYMLITWILAPSDLPQWMVEARTQPMVKQGADLLMTLVPAEVRGEAAARIDPELERVRKAKEAVETLQRLSTPRPDTGRAGTPAHDSGYKEQDRSGLNRLMQTN
ncbi:membrane protein required for colicin V production [Azospirillaceae bacterium]